MIASQSETAPSQPTEPGPRPWQDRRSLVRRIASTYPAVPRLYTLLRFAIIRARILTAMDALLPSSGTLLELGCGFGLFAGYFAACERQRRLIGIDLQAHRVAMARGMATKLGVDADFFVADVRGLPPIGDIHAAYMLDVLHHIPFSDQRRVIAEVISRLPDNGVLLIKEVTTVPNWRLTFTRVLDRAMAPQDTLAYRHHEDWRDLLEHLGCVVRVQHLPDYLPYPHVLLTCRKAVSGSSAHAVEPRVLSRTHVG